MNGILHLTVEDTSIRAYCIGQNRAVHVHKLISLDTLEERMTS